MILAHPRDRCGHTHGPFPEEPRSGSGGLRALAASPWLRPQAMMSWAAQRERTRGDVTLFEYLSVSTSIVLSLSAAQLLGNLREVFDPARRYWVHALWAVQILWIHVNYWWRMWAYRDVQSWNFVSFATVLLVPGLLFICSSALAPTYSRSVSSWEEHFFTVRPWFFAARSFIVVASGFRAWLLLDSAPLQSLHPIQYLILVASVMGLVSSNRRLHRILAVVTFACTFGLSYVRMRPGV